MLTLNFTEPQLWSKVRAHPSTHTRSLTLTANGRQLSGSKSTSVCPISVWSHLWNAKLPRALCSSAAWMQKQKV